VEEHSPYQASDATTVPDDAQLRANRLPQDISGPIKTMWVTGYVMATFALLISLILAFMMFRRLELGDVSTVEVLLTAGGAMLDAVVFAALSWAIRRHSRIAAWSILGLLPGGSGVVPDAELGRGVVPACSRDGGTDHLHPWPHSNECLPPSPATGKPSAGTRSHQ
jgi:uncharacterized membrane protein